MDEKEKSKSLVVKETTWARLHSRLYRNGIKSMQELISHLLDIADKYEVNNGTE